MNSLSTYNSTNHILERMLPGTSAARATQTPYYAAVHRTHEAAGRVFAQLEGRLTPPVAGIIGDYLRIDSRVIKALLKYEPHATMDTATASDKLYICIERMRGGGIAQYQITLSHIKQTPITATMPTGSMMGDVAVLTLTDKNLWEAFISGDKLADIVESAMELHPDEFTEDRSQYHQYKRQVAMMLIGVVHQFAAGEI